MTQLEKLQVKMALSRQVILLVLVGVILLSTFFFPYAIAQGNRADEIVKFNRKIDSYELLLNISGQSAPNGYQILKSTDLRQLSMFNWAKICLFIWQGAEMNNEYDTMARVQFFLVLCMPLLNVIIPIAIILNALLRKPFWVLFYTAAAYGNFLWQRFYLGIDNLIASEMYRPGIVLQLLPCACIVSTILALWMWVKKVTVRRKIKAERATSS